jgi:Uma2 family endonuclease
MSIASQRMTLDEFLAKHEHDPVLEYAQGVVTEKMSPGWDHADLQMLIGQTINVYARPRRLAAAFSELRTTMRDADVSRIPDLSVYVWDRIERNPVARQHGAYLPADVAIEIMSPGQTRGSQLSRCREFVASGSQAALLFEPANRSVTEVRRGGIERTYHDGDQIDLSDIVSGLTLNLGELFSELGFE